MAINIALAGNPNSGKTTMFNDLTGSAQYVGNWPGVTVEKKDGKLRGNKDVIIQDLPGIYSLSPYTLEEVVTRNYLINQKPDAIINIVDASNIERNLYLTTQLAEIGVPMILALNMIDIVRKNGDIIDGKKLAEFLGCEVIETSALKKIGSKEVADKAVLLAKSSKGFVPQHTFAEEVEEALDSITALITGIVRSDNLRWYAIKLFERDKEVLKEVSLSADIRNQIEELISTCEERMDDDSESIITIERYSYIDSLIGKCVKSKSKGKLSTSDKIDQIVTNRVLALPIFAFVMFLVYFISISTVGTMMTDWTNESLFGEIVPEFIEGFFNEQTPEWLSGLILDGIVGGVGAVIGFLPQMLVLFICLAIVEDCGYMARVAFILDRVFRKFGLSGKSFIPMLISTGCGVPGIMASRTIENESDRRLTITTTTFVPCGAKLPIIALISGALFPESAWVAPSVYFLGIVSIIISGIILKKTRRFAGDPAPFVMELPAYHMPTFKGVMRTMLERGWAFVKKAGSIVLLATVLIWFLSSFDWSLEMVDPTESILAKIGGVVAPLFIPLGWGDWRAAVATVTGLIAKENVVGTFGVLFGMVEEVSEDGLEYWPQLAQSFSAVAGYSFLAFNMLCAPCFAAIGALRREMMSDKWTWFAVGYQCGFAYLVSIIIFQMGSLFTGGGFGFGTILGFAAIAVLIYLLVRKPSKAAIQELPQKAVR